jgi:hypothetical protein
MRIVVGGFLGLLPAGGVTWDYIQYVLGFARLGHEVYYVEDTGLWPIYQDNPDSGATCETNVAYLAGMMSDFGLADRWAYRDEVTGEWFGLSETKVKEILRTTDMMVNVSCANVTRDEYLAIPVRVLIDSDPMFTQIQHRDSMAFFPGTPGMRATVAAHTHHFSFGERIGAADCRVPECGVTWLPTRQPVCTWLWPVVDVPSGKPRFTTVMNWAANRAFDYEGEQWGQKDVEFKRFMNLPGQVPTMSLEIAVTQTKEGTAAFPVSEVRSAGWTVVDPRENAGDWKQYQNFLQGSLAEFSVAKEAYVKGRTGWFSCRSACYLASGRPVVTQDTGWSELIPSGRGLFAFDDVESAIDGLRAIAAEPQTHARAASEIAFEYFDSDKVLGSMIDRVS